MYHMQAVTLLMLLLASNALAECDSGSEMMCEDNVDSAALLQTKAYTKDVTEGDDEFRSISGGDDSKACKKKCFLDAGLLPKAKQCRKESRPEGATTKWRACLKPLLAPVKECRHKCGDDKTCKNKCFRDAVPVEERQECAKEAFGEDFKTKMKTCMAKFVTPELKACRAKCDGAGFLEEDDSIEDAEELGEDFIEDTEEKDVIEDTEDEDSIEDTEDGEEMLGEVQTKAYTTETEKHPTGSVGTPDKVPDTIPDRFLNSHNYWRCIHGSPPIKWDKDVAQGAQEWANRGQMSHSDCYHIPPPQGPVGENLAEGSSMSPEQACKMWHDENPDKGPNCGGHCTAMLWKSAFKLGCGIKDGLVVCRYGGNSLRDGTPNFGSRSAYNQNVGYPDNSKEAECKKKWPQSAKGGGGNNPGRGGGKNPFGGGGFGGGGGNNPFGGGGFGGGGGSNPWGGGGGGGGSNPWGGGGGGGGSSPWGGGGSGGWR